MERPSLREIKLDLVMAELLAATPGVYVTMSEGQWDIFLEAAYRCGHTLLELNNLEIPTRAFKRNTC